MCLSKRIQTKLYDTFGLDCVLIDIENTGILSEAAGGGSNHIFHK